LPLREVAERHLPLEFARGEKKAMQYGSGIWKAIGHLSSKNGYYRPTDWIKSLKKLL